MSTQDQVNRPYSSDVGQTVNETDMPPKVEQIRRSVIKLSGHILGFIIGLIGALLIFVATNFLVLKGGQVVGPHMGLLDQFLVGYSVTFIGSLVGAGYAFIIGYGSGLFVAAIYNWVISREERMRGHLPND